MRMPTWIRQHLAALRALLVLTVVTGIIYPLAVWGISFLPGLHSKAEGSLISVNGRTVGSDLIGQQYLDKDGNPLKQYFQSRPSAAGAGYDPTATSASNLGPESIVDILPDPAIIAKGKTDPNAKTSLLTAVCSRSAAIGTLEGVDGSRPFCTSGGVGAVLSVIGPRDRHGHVVAPTQVVSVNEECSTDPKKPVTPFLALDPHISPAYAGIQAARIAKARGISLAQVQQAINDNENARGLGFIGAPRVNVLRLNLELDAKYPLR